MSRLATLEKLTTAIPLIAPSMLKCDFGNLQREVELLHLARTQILHLDVMDGHFVPNLSYGPMVIERMRKLTEIVFDAHLMISDPQKYLDDYLKAGCDCITVHIEAVPQPVPLLKSIRAADVVAGLAINPQTPLELIEDALEECDLVLVMSVEPGFGGQTFIPSSLEKLKRLKKLVAPTTLLSIDGGIGLTTIGSAAAAGAQIFVAGSAIFDMDNYGIALDNLTKIAADNSVDHSSFSSR